ncbi:MAG: tetratricopeptide repeat protein [Candidatus Aminicenantes bacterium]|nr:tetratricopeptide repeat protein [Candidatus Aminicenantes bacterium]
MKKRGLASALFFLLIFLFAILAAPAESEKKIAKKAQKLMVKALEAINQKQPDQAIDLLNQALALTPNNAVVHHNLGVLYFEKGTADKAIGEFEEALRLQSDYKNAQLALCQALFESGKAASNKKDFEKANAYLLKLRDMPYTDKENKNMQAMVRYLLGYNFYNLKQYPQAQENFASCQAVEGLEKDNLDLYANATYFLGMIGYISNKFEDSCVFFKKYLQLYAAMEKKPELFSQANFFVGANLFRLLEAKMGKGDVTRMAADAAEVMPYLEQAIADKTIPNEDAYVMLGNCHVYRKEYDQAMRVYQQLIEAFPQSTQLNSYQLFMKELQKMQLQAEKPKKKH